MTIIQMVVSTLMVGTLSTVVLTEEQKNMDIHTEKSYLILEKTLGHKFLIAKNNVMTTQQEGIEDTTISGDTSIKLKTISGVDSDIEIGSAIDTTITYTNIVCSTGDAGEYLEVRNDNTVNYVKYDSCVDSTFEEIKG